jgi:Ran GTPase-activating protein (RanGAP) involved in mRNA processing and transport
VDGDPPSRDAPNGDAPSNQAQNPSEVRSEGQIESRKPEASKASIADILTGDNLLKEYSAAANKAGLSVSKLISRSLVESRLKGESSGFADATLWIDAPGNDPAAFNSRLSDRDVPVMCEVFGPVSGYLLRLNLSYNELTDTGVVALAGSMLGPQTGNLCVLNLRGNSMGASGCEAICQAVERSASLVQLDLSHNPIGRQGGLAVVKLLQRNAALKELFLSDTEIDIDVLVALAAVLLVNNQSLRALDVSNPRTLTLQEEHTVHFGRMLRTNTGLSEVHLGKHRMRDAGVRQLVSYLLENKTLRILDLRGNEIGADGATSIAMLLKNDCQITELNLSNNRIGEMDNTTGAAAIAASLLENRMLSHLDLNHNGLCGEALQALASAIDENSTLESIALFHNKWDQPASYKFHQILNDRARVFPINADFLTSEVDLRIDVCLVHDFKHTARQK